MKTIDEEKISNMLVVRILLEDIGNVEGFNDEIEKVKDLLDNYVDESDISELRSQNDYKKNVDIEIAIMGSLFGNTIAKKIYTMTILNYIMFDPLPDDVQAALFDLFTNLKNSINKKDLEAWFAALKKAERDEINDVSN